MFKESAVDHIIHNLKGLYVATDESYRDGFTIWAESGTYFIEPKSYMVGGVIPALILSTAQTLADVYVEVTQWYEGALIVNPNPIVGAWVKDGFIHLDLITITHSERQALLLGKIFRQEAVGSLDWAGTFHELEIAYV